MSLALEPDEGKYLSSKIKMEQVTDEVLAPMGRFPSLPWHIAFGLAQTTALLLIGPVIYQMFYGLGIFGITNPVGWGVYIVTFVFWVGIGHAGTLISAILFLFRQNWRTSINRSAEAMTIFAVMTAGLFPLIHVGRTWVAYWLVPYPAERALWVNFRSPLLWDVFAVTTYFTVSLLFWYQGLIPDWATARDRAKNKFFRTIYSILSFGWSGSSRDWIHYERAYRQFAFLATPLVLSVHSIVSFDFAVANIPGWHTTIFPPYFVAGAIFSGFAMVVTLLVIMRVLFKLEHYITMKHLELMNKVILATSLLVGYAYASEFYIAWYSGHEYEQYQFVSRISGFMLGTSGSIFYAITFWGMVICNVIIPHLFWSKKIRTNILAMFIISIFVNIGMWLERFNIFILSLHNDFLPSSWGYYIPTIFDWMVVIGSFGFFFTLFLIFCRVFPTLAIAELKATLPAPSHGSRLDDHGHDHDDHGHGAHAPAKHHSTTAEAH
jgi:molybdopterin-containing oxidoreductase family membrane subunit